MTTRGVYKFHFDCGRNGSLSGVISMTDDEHRAIIGRNVYFGEVLGKHSDVYGVIDPGELTLVTDDPTAVEVFDTHGFASGWDPRDYLGDDMDDEGDDA